MSSTQKVWISYRSREVGEAFRTLHETKIVRLIYPTTDLLPKLNADLKKAPRLQFLDTGLFSSSWQNRGNEI